MDAIFGGTMWKVKSALLGLSLIAGFNFGCGRMPSDDYSQAPGNNVKLGDDVSLNTQAQEILETHCSSCHGNQSNTGLDNIADLQKLAASSFVRPGDPSASLLYKVIAEGSMPPNHPLTGTETSTIAAWISSLKEAPPPSPTPVPSPTPNPTPASPPSASPSPTPSTASYSYIYTNILKPKCLSCHGGAGGYSYNSYKATMKSVVAGKPNSSLLYRETQSGSMPRGGKGKLSVQQLDAISKWIQAGAPNN